MSDHLIEGTEQKLSGKRGYIEQFFRVTPTKNAAFITKLYNMVEEESTAHLITWTGSGDKFTIFNNVQFSNKVLPRYFKHCNWSSFVRQLNMYDFHKINENNSEGDKSPKSDNEQQRWDFKHPCFMRHGRDRLHKIRRKSPRHRIANTGCESSNSSSSCGNTPEDPTVGSLIYNTSYTNNVQMNENKALEDVILQLKSTTEQIELKLESTTNEVLYLRQVAATQQKLLNDLLGCIHHLKGGNGSPNSEQSRKPTKIHELLEPNNSYHGDHQPASGRGHAKRRKT
ncbi:unnamed protein product [Rhizopus microsporus]